MYIGLAGLFRVLKGVGLLLGEPGSQQRFPAGTTMTSRPSEFAPGTPTLPIIPVFPEEPRPPKRSKETGTMTEDQIAEAEDRLHLQLQGKSLWQWGLRPVDVVSAIDRLGVTATGGNLRSSRECFCCFSVSGLGFRA